MKIDLVYLWCSDSDVQFNAILNETKKNYLIYEDKDKLDVRVADHNELRYSLRSVEQFAPWIHHIYIVTFNQVPKWLNINHPKITIIDHSQIIPKEYLPTFNSTVIEAFIHKIPGLSEHFLMANDDTFFGNETSSDFFFNQDGKPIHYIHFNSKSLQNNWWSKMLKKGRRLAEMDTNRFIKAPACSPAHNIDPYTKSLYRDTINHFENVYKEMYPNKFRRNNDVQRFLVSCWGHLSDRLIWKSIDFQKFGYIEKVTPQFIEKFLNNNRPNLFCINDSYVLDEADYKNRSELLQKLFPNKSEFEKDDSIDNSVLQNYGVKPAFNKNNISVVFTINGQFIPFCGIVLASLLKNISDKNNYDIIILTIGGNSELLKALIPVDIPSNVSVRTWGIIPLLEEYKNIFNKFPPEKTAKWIKIFLPKLLPHYSKVIYLDVDTLVKCDIAELWNMDLDGKAVGGVTDMATHHIDSLKEEHMKKIFHCDNIDDYINLGVIVMDIDMLRKFNLSKKPWV